MYPNWNSISMPIVPFYTVQESSVSSLLVKVHTHSVKPSTLVLTNYTLEFATSCIKGGSFDNMLLQWLSPVASVISPLYRLVKCTKCSTLTRHYCSQPQQTYLTDTARNIGHIKRDRLRTAVWWSRRMRLPRGLHVGLTEFFWLFQIAQGSILTARRE